MKTDKEIQDKLRELLKGSSIGFKTEKARLIQAAFLIGIQFGGEKIPPYCHLCHLSGRSIAADKIGGE